MKSMLDDDKKFDDEKYYKEVKEGKHDKNLREMLRVELKKGNEKGYDVFEQALKGYKSGSELAKARLDRARIIMKQEQDRDIRLLNSDEQNFLQQMEIFMDDPNKREENYTGGKTMKKNLLEDDRVAYSPGGKVVGEIIGSFLSKRSKLEKELMTENMSKTNQKKNIKEIEEIDKKVDTLQKQQDEGAMQEQLASIEAQKSSEFNNLVSKGASEKEATSALNKAYDNKDYSEIEELTKRLGLSKGGGPGIEALRKEAPEVVERMGYQEGGSMDDQMMMVMTPPMESDDDMEDGYTKFIMEEALNEEEENMLTFKLEQDEELSMLFDKIIDVAQEFAGSGPVEGPGSGVSDSIPARLSDGEFVFTTKAVEEIGEDVLMSMMKEAEAAVDERQQLAVGGAPVMEEKIEEDLFGKPLESDIADDEIRKGMLSTNPRLK